MTDPRSTLCLACGLCCDGNLFTQVPLRAEEVEPIRHRGLPILERPHGAALRQRCGALDGRRCDIYDDRPAACRSYRCMLLTALAEDEVSLRDALAIVERAHALLAAAPGAAAQPLRQRVPSEAAPEAARALAYLGRHFQRDAGL
jgi:hypothetical protein